MTQPEWATLLIKDVLFLHNRNKAPKIEWKKTIWRASGTTHKSSDWKSSLKKRGYFISSRSRYSKRPDITMRIIEGSEEKGLLLHELAHWLVRSGHHHDKVFYKKAFELYYVFLTKEEFERYIKTEFSYKERSKIVYQEMFKK